MSVQVPNFAGMSVPAAVALANSLGHTLVQGDDPYYSLSLAAPGDSVIWQDTPAQTANQGLYIRIKVARARVGFSVPFLLSSDNGRTFSADAPLTADSTIGISNP